MKTKKTLLITLGITSVILVGTSIAAMTTKILSDKTNFSLSQDLKGEINDVESLKINQKAFELKKIFPSQLKDTSLLTSENINLKFKNNPNVALDPKIKVSYELITDENKQKQNHANDDEGSLLVRLIFSLGRAKASKDVKLFGFKTLVENT
ncbi:lipoprotein 17-related variable surface protein [Mycoplasmopsis pulmonis]|nr:lipoprotein 17-related variable surface protein [Mycoplasmopsis pulmonis]MDZ7293671.1 lipoprotein 17-related variable surface protein [Mycoplasmopsis pulmonis]VEU68411.1 Lipoprotein associated domain [Mycoplasmopsis pulmonis]